jgi:hypothetical protein
MLCVLQVFHEPLDAVAFCLQVRLSCWGWERGGGGGMCKFVAAAGEGSCIARGGGSVVAQLLGVGVCSNLLKLSGNSCIMKGGGGEG